MIEKKIKISCLCLIAISSAIVLFDFYFRFLVGQELTPNKGFQLLPQEALVTLYISTNSQNWQQIKKLAPPEVRSLLKQELNTFISRTAVLKEIDYQQDVRPWIGNVMLVFLPRNNLKIESDRENYLLIVGIKNKIELLNFANKLENDTERQLESNNYQNIPIVKVIDRDNNFLF